MTTLEFGPDWLAAEMPPGYNTRLLEIQRLSEELRAMGRFGQLLWTVGDQLTEAVRDAFTAMKFETTAGSQLSALTVTVDGHRRLLILVSSSSETIQKKSPELAQVFQLHQDAAEADRIVLVVNAHAATRPADRPAALDVEAMKLLQRLGANVLSGPTLFALWTLSLQDRDRARAYVDRLHQQDGGMFEFRI